jgi:DNA-binding PadR family transcriptional regulator
MESEYMTTYSRVCKTRAVRRKPGALLPLEVAILEVASSQDEALHGFELARQLAEADDTRSLTAHGTLYKALGRLADAGLLESQWEDPELALAAGRPRRRLYHLTDAGAQRLAAEHQAPASPSVLRPTTA